MKIVLGLIAALLFFSGLVWFLQGINILPGSFMTGQTQWALYGGQAMLAGAGLFTYAVRRRG